MKYINRTGSKTPIGKIVKLDNDAKGVSFPSGTNILVLGVVVAISGNTVDVLSDGIRDVFINGSFRSGDIVYLKKSSQSGQLGTCYASAGPGAPYAKVGVVMESGRNRLARAVMGIGIITEDAVGGAETDPVFTASAAHGISSTDINNWDAAGSGIQEEFETVSKNLKGYPYVITYDGDDIDYITYNIGGGDLIVKTFNYTLGVLTSIVLSGNTPSGIELTKTLSYTGDNLTGVSYS